uniref:uncharacterized protein LOC120340958 n=1 Tax=Styela clava TaxID=7725 RepID=UPI00193A3C56|nr:uncharacterized protein LOC120340958 [Styela clava]
MKIALSICVVLLCASVGMAIKCYVCANCSEPYNLIDCGDGFSGCGKVTVAGVVGRTCTASSETADCNTVELLGVKTETCNCGSDECNGAGMLKASTIVTTIFSFILAKFFL